MYRHQLKKNGEMVMRTRRFTILLMMIATSFGMLFSSVNVFAAHDILATVQGTVCKGTNSDILCIYNTSEGTYKIKIDSDTDTSACKVISIGKNVKVEIYRGDDGYLHAASISGTGANRSVSVDSDNSATVEGTVLDSTTEDIMYLNTAQGEMQIKLDTTTNFSGCRIIISGMKVRALVARGNDAYMHALSVYDANTTSQPVTYQTVDNSESSNTGSIDNSVPEGTVAVSGIPQDNSTSDRLYLLTDSGVMLVAIDESTDTTGGYIFTNGNKLTAYVYRGDDAIMHAKKLTGTKAENVEKGTVKSTFVGTVSSSSTEDTLVMLTSGGTMKFKLDSSTTLTGAKGVVKGKVATVSATTGSDKFWHAISVTVK